MPTVDEIKPISNGSKLWSALSYIIIPVTFILVDILIGLVVSSSLFYMIFLFIVVAKLSDNIQDPDINFHVKQSSVIYIIIRYGINSIGLALSLSILGVAILFGKVGERPEIFDIVAVQILKITEFIFLFSWLLFPIFAFMVWKNKSFDIPFISAAIAKSIIKRKEE